MVLLLPIDVRKIKLLQVLIMRKRMNSYGNESSNAINGDVKILVVKEQFL